MSDLDAAVRRHEALALAVQAHADQPDTVSHDQDRDTRIVATAAVFERYLTGKQEDARQPEDVPLAEHMQWLSEQRASGRRLDTDELWTLLYQRLGENRSLTNRVWQTWVANPLPRTGEFNPAYQVARCGESGPHSPHVVDHGPDQPRNCPGRGVR